MIEILINLDQNILLAIQEYVRTPILTPIFIMFTTLGNSGMIWILISLGLLIFKKTRKVGIVSLCALFGSVIINNEILKHLVGRVRPFDVIWELNVLIPKPNDFSFPSGHTASSFAVASTLSRKLPPKYGIPAIILASIISFSRLYVGVHYPSDVLFGMIIGILISYLVEFFVDIILKVLIEKKQVK